MGLPIENRRHSIQQYLDLEEKSEIRHEFHDGEILAMAGGTYRHSQIFINLAAMFFRRLAGGPCQPLDGNLRVRIHRRASYVYPDLSVVCGPAEFDADDTRKTSILNPRVIVEILSDSTESYDRGGKFSLYREIPSFEEYVVVSQRVPLVETFLRQPDGSWVFNVASGLDVPVRIQSLQLQLALADIYSRVEFDDLSARLQSP